MVYVKEKETELKLRIILESPPPGVDFGLQKGSGSNYETIQTQRSTTGDLSFEFAVRIKPGKDSLPNFGGPFVQGSTNERFIYIDIGTSAGQTGTSWSRRLKIPLTGITGKMINQLLSESSILETRVAGTGKDGSPSCGTVKPFAGWKIGGIK